MAGPVPRLLAAALVLAGAAASAQTVSLQGMLGRQALLIVDGAPPRGVAPGASHKGVKVVSTAGDEAVVEIGGRRHTLRVGEAPASVGPPAGPRGSRIVLTAASGGHFLAQGAINGRAANFVVDTGATYVSMGAAEAQRLGVNYQGGPKGFASTANGVVPAWRAKIDSLRIGDVEVFDVDALVSPQPVPQILLGNSFLNRFQMKRDNEQMVLERRY
ncbi:retropepsin-like aspartic protease [Ramlibacter sp.]|uniref:retropepsin-like aspartic protease family protein n=1 Tax=Ramlibacter sp. TaxID=1917967 RepID=UPI002C62595C|nr:retropepsin-like aspartic protease [Ramlibacter sp.]HWI82257.1 retropepsin-like aspartic protease [Ramlibacter sp.]